jgi:hypothetical protein
MRRGPGGELFPIPSPAPAAREDERSASRGDAPLKPPQTPPGLRRGPGGELYPIPAPRPAAPASEDPLDRWRKALDPNTLHRLAPFLGLVPGGNEISAGLDLASYVAHRAPRNWGFGGRRAAAADGYPTQGPPLAGAPRDSVGLPYPGSLSFGSSCGRTLGVKGLGPLACKPSLEKAKKPESPVSVEASLTETRQRGNEVLNPDGTRSQTLSVETDLRVTGKGEAGRKTLEADLAGFAGHRLSYEVTVGPDRADGISDGTDRAPNPVDPRSLRDGEGLVLNEDSYGGTEAGITITGTAAPRAR